MACQLTKMGLLAFFCNIWSDADAKRFCVSKYNTQFVMLKVSHRFLQGSFKCRI